MKPVPADVMEHTEAHKHLSCWSLITPLQYYGFISHNSTTSDSVKTKQGAKSTNLYENTWPLILFWLFSQAELKQWCLLQALYTACCPDYNVPLLYNCSKWENWGKCPALWEAVSVSITIFVKIVFLTSHSQMCSLPFPVETQAEKTTTILET